MEFAGLTPQLLARKISALHSFEVRFIAVFLTSRRKERTGDIFPLFFYRFNIITIRNCAAQHCFDPSKVVVSLRQYATRTVSFTNFFCHSSIHRPTDNFAGIKILEGSQIEPAFIGRDGVALALGHPVG